MDDFAHLFQVVSLLEVAPGGHVTPELSATVRRVQAKRRQRAVMASDSEWDRITARAQAAGMEVSRFIVHACTVPEPLPTTVLRRVAREVLVLSKVEQQRMEDLGASGRWRKLADAVDDWLEREETLAGLTDPGASARWEVLGAVSDGHEQGER